MKNKIRANGVGKFCETLKINGFWKFPLIITSLFLFNVSVDAKIRSVGTAAEMQRFITKSPIVIALFYKNDVEKKSLIQIYKQVSDMPEYDETGMVFITVDVDQKGLSSLMKNYDIHSIPTIILFKNGQVISYNGKIVQLVDPHDSIIIQAFIEKNCSGKIIRLVEDREKRIEQQQQEARKKDPYFDTGAEVYSDFPRPYERNPYSKR